MPEESEEELPRLCVRYPRVNALIAEYLDAVRHGEIWLDVQEAVPKGTEVCFDLFAPTVTEPFELIGRIEECTEPREGQDARRMRVALRAAGPGAELHGRMEALAVERFGHKLAEELFLTGSER